VLYVYINVVLLQHFADSTPTCQQRAQGIFAATALPTRGNRRNTMRRKTVRHRQRYRMTGHFSLDCPCEQTGAPTDSGKTIGRNTDQTALTSSMCSLC